MSTTVFTVPLTPGSPDGDPTYTERMVAKAEGRPYDPAKAEPKAEEKVEKKPEEKPEETNYKKLYEELLAKQKQLEKVEEKKEEKPEEKEGATEEAAKEALESKGLDLAEFQKEFTDKGELSEESYKKLADAGIDRATVDAYIEGRKAVAEAYSTKVYGAAGGAERYTEMVTWAKDNLTPEEIAAYDSAVTSGDFAKAELAVKGLYVRFTENVGEPPSGLLKGSPGATVGDSFKSKAEMITAISDPRYAKDPAYRKEVEAKIHRSNLV